MAEVRLFGNRRVFRRVSPRTSHQVCLSATVDLDGATEARATAELRAIVDSPAVRECVIDASRVFVDVRGLAVLLEGARLAGSRGCRLMVVPPRSVRRMCRILDLGGQLQLVDAGAVGHRWAATLAADITAGHLVAGSDRDSRGGDDRVR